MLLDEMQLLARAFGSFVVCNVEGMAVGLVFGDLRWGGCDPAPWDPALEPGALQ